MKLLIFFSGLFIPTVLALAAGGSISAKLANPAGANSDLISLLGKVLGLMVDIGFPILVLAIVYTGFLFVKAQGNQTELDNAKKAFFWTIVGGVVLLGASIFAQAISGTIDQVTGRFNASSYEQNVAPQYKGTGFDVY